MTGVGPPQKPQNTQKCRTLVKTAGQPACRSPWSSVRTKEGKSAEIPSQGGHQSGPLARPPPQCAAGPAQSVRDQYFCGISAISAADNPRSRAWMLTSENDARSGFLRILRFLRQP